MIQRYVSLSQQAYEQIKRKIVSLELAPGALINEGELRHELSLGRTPIREALQRLANERLVMIVPRRGMFVTDIGVADLPRIFEIRLALEPAAVRFAAQRGQSAHWNQMQALLDSSKVDGHQVNNERMIVIDQTCHEIIYDAAQNPFLIDTLSTLYALSLRLWFFSLSQIGSMNQALDEHRQILDALRRQDGDLAADLMVAHIRSFQEEIQAVMLGMPG
ncbi:MAG: GntR family transcriptional regulator [Anaerolineales bacterium]|nr:GntR family transcriptional regulator [Anaerolineales bacterium]MCB0019115.1 GntR family transcriptional regulator [Anaerolineales bacterium]MCB0030259.1 GntR family transcriptional regulator [Anaerolineales bacterium]MCB8962162.1 GntR family transcriptional regulator [Ardenticatenales bacterium]